MDNEALERIYVSMKEDQLIALLELINEDRGIVYLLGLVNQALKNQLSEYQASMDKYRHNDYIGLVRQINGITSVLEYMIKHEERV